MNVIELEEGLMYYVITHAVPSEEVEAFRVVMNRLQIEVDVIVEAIRRG